MAEYVTRIFWNTLDEKNEILGASWLVFAPISIKFLSILGKVFSYFLWNFVKLPWAVSKWSGFANLTPICIFIESMVLQNFQMKDLLKGFPGVMNLAMFGKVLVPLQSF